MPRIRTIKPEITSDAKLARVSRVSRLHYVYLWTVSDDEGFFRATPRLLLGQLYQHDRDIGEAEVDRMTAELVEHGFVVLHQTVDGPIGCIRNWLKHQRIDRPSKSHLEPLTHGKLAKVSRDTREGTAHLVLSPESLVLSPETDASSSGNALLPLVTGGGLMASASAPDQAAVSVRQQFLDSMTRPEAWAAMFKMAIDGAYGAQYKPTDAQLDEAIIDFRASIGDTQPSPQHFRAFLKRAIKGPKPDDAPADKRSAFAETADRLTRSQAAT